MPISTPNVPPEQPTTKWVPPSVGIDSVKGCTLKFSWQETFKRIDPFGGSCVTHLTESVYYPYTNFRPTKVTLVNRYCHDEVRNVEGLWAMQTLWTTIVYGCELNWVIESWGSQTYLDQVLSYVYFYHIPSSYCSYTYPFAYINDYGLVVDQRIVSEPTITAFACNPVRPPNIYTPPIALPIYTGNAAPPPPPPKNMNCCDCNTIASIVESQMYARLAAEQKLFEDIKDHIDKRALEIIIKDLEHLRALDFEEFLKAVIKRINEVESNLWNGAKQ